MARKKTGSAAKATPSAKSTKSTAKAKADTVFRLKIALKDFSPMIWRRIETPDCTLWDVHAIIQLSMPWFDAHMWDFAITRDERYGPDDDTEMDYHDADRMKLSELAARGVKKFTYTYDFGDTWEHIITLEKPVARDPKAKYPRCIAGERRGPPEDCGGVWGYANLLEILDDPKHPEYEERVEWLGRVIDPEAFDIDDANAALNKLKFK